jgi:hypothetical protein
MKGEIENYEVTMKNLRRRLPRYAPKKLTLLYLYKQRHNPFAEHVS